MEATKERGPKKPNGKRGRPAKKNDKKEPKASSKSVQAKKKAEPRSQERSKDRAKKENRPKPRERPAPVPAAEEQDTVGGDSLSVNLKYFRNEGFQQIIKEKTDCTVSKQALTFLAASMEFVASELIAESLRHCLNNRIVPKAVFRTIEDDPDLADLFRDGIVLDSLPAKKGDKLKVTGNQVQ